jgi:hypothetical protein
VQQNQRQEGKEIAAHPATAVLAVHNFCRFYTKAGVKVGEESCQLRIIKGPRNAMYHHLHASAAFRHSQPRRSHQGWRKSVMSQPSQAMP